MATKTNAVRLIERTGIPFRETYYQYDLNDLSGLHAAEALDLPADQVFKTLVVRGARTGIHVFCIPVTCELDLKKAAKVVDDKSVEMVHVRDLLSLTGYIRGGCSPVAMKKNYPTHFDETCLLYDEIAVSAGERGHQIILSGKALGELIGASFVDVIL